MKEIKITDNCIIYNDMPRGWKRGKGQPKWHLSIHNRWYRMWNRCNNPKDKDYESYKDCKIAEEYRYLSKYLEDLEKLDNFDKLINNLKDWHIDKDSKDPSNRNYYFDNLSIICKKDNIEEMLNRKSSPKSKKPIIGIPINKNKVLIFEYVSQADKYNFYHSNIIKCCKGKLRAYKGYKWHYINIIKL